MMTIGATIFNLRTARDWSLQELAQRAGVSKGYLSTLENDIVDPSLSHLELIARAFGLGAGDLLVMAGYTVSPTPQQRTVTVQVTIWPDGSSSAVIVPSFALVADQ